MLEESVSPLALELPVEQRQGRNAWLMPEKVQCRLGVVLCIQRDIRPGCSQSQTKEVAFATAVFDQ
jgi:hypothetical protein